MTPRGCAPLVRGGGQGGKKLQGLLLGLGSCPVSPSCSSASPSPPSGSLWPIWFWHVPRAATYIARASISPLCWPAGCNLLISGWGSSDNTCRRGSKHENTCLLLISYPLLSHSSSSCLPTPCPLAGSSPTLAGEQKPVQGFRLLPSNGSSSLRESSSTGFSSCIQQVGGTKNQQSW